MRAEIPARAARIVERAEHVVPAFGDKPEAGPDPAVAVLARVREEAEAVGYRRATAELEAERRAFAVQTARTLARLAEFEESAPRRHDAHLAEIVLESVSRIVRQRIDAGDPVAVRALREAQDALPNTTGLRARLHPADLEAAALALQPEIERGRIQVVSDDTLTRGGCVLESGVGTVDATLETAHEAIRGALVGESA